MRALEALGPGIFVLGLLAFGWTGCGTLGWRLTFPPQSPTVGFWPLLRAKAVADGLNVLLPLLSLGGEPLRALWLGRSLGINRAAATVVISKLNFIAAGFLLVLFAIPALAASGVLTPKLALGLALFLSLGGLGFSGGYLAVRRRKVRKLPALLRRLRLPLRSDAEARWLEIDELLYAFCFAGGGRSALVLLLHLLERGLHALEFWLLFWLMDLPMGPLEAFSAYALATAANTAFFFMPAGQIGVSEGSQTLALVWLGASPETGLAISLARRLRSLVWAGCWVLWGRQALADAAPGPAH